MRPPVTDVEAVQRGAALFQAGGCGSCHSGSRHTDGQMHVIRGTLVDTPTLTGVSRSGPWLHDGTARSLMAVVDLAGAGEMGSLPNATADDLRDLVAYLETL